MYFLRQQCSKRTVSCCLRSKSAADFSVLRLPRGRNISSFSNANANVSPNTKGPWSGGSSSSRALSLTPWHSTISEGFSVEAAPKPAAEIVGSDSSKAEGVTVGVAFAKILGRLTTALVAALTSSAITLALTEEETPPRGFNGSAGVREYTNDSAAGPATTATAAATEPSSYSEDDDGEQVNSLVEAAHELRRRLSPPHQSLFRVVCLLVYEDSSGGFHRVTGTNAEPSTIGGSICAERAALCKLREARDCKRVTKVVVVTDNPGPVAPGVLCREFLSAHLPPSTPVVMAGSGSEEASTSTKGGFAYPGASVPLADVNVCTVGDLYPWQNFYGTTDRGNQLRLGFLRQQVQ